jgi:glyoxylase-like metal-dependent hydrolase (beta-lactamase superfamily II)
MLMGIGGNIAVSNGVDGVFIVDDDVAPMSPKIKAAIATISPAPVEMVFNTHWHFDHTGGNTVFGEQGALIVAHDNVRQRMSTPQFSSFFNTETKPSPDVALPVITFDNTATFHLNGQTIRAIHTTPAHTDGDAIFIFEEANVVHLGDVFFNGMYPFIDIDGGGSVQGIIDAVDSILPMLNEDTQIIPGHGPLATLNDLKSYRSMLKLVTARIQVLVDEGKTREDVIILRPTFNFDEDWSWSFLPPERWAGLIYDSVVEAAAVTPADGTD